MKYAFIEKHRATWAVRPLCRLMGVSHSGFYDCLGRKPSQRERTNQVLKAHIQESFHGSDRTYGSPRVWRDLLDWGHACSENRIARLMRQLGNKARTRRRRQPRRYIEIYYNRQRRHSRLRYLAPAVFAKRYQDSAAAA